MRCMGYLCLGMLLFGVAGGVSRAAVDVPVGVIEIAQDARLDAYAATSGSNLYKDSRLETDSNGRARFRAGKSSFDLEKDTDVRIVSTGPLHLSITRGTANFSLAVDEKTVIETPVGFVYAKEGEPGLGIVIVKDENETTVCAHNHNLILDNAGELHDILAGKCHRVKAADQANSQKLGIRRRSLIIDIIAGGGLGGGAIALWHHESESPYKPCSQSQAQPCRSSE